MRATPQQDMHYSCITHFWLSSVVLSITAHYGGRSCGQPIVAAVIMLLPSDGVLIIASDPKPHRLVTKQAFDHSMFTTQVCNVPRVCTEYIMSGISGHCRATVPHKSRHYIICPGATVTRSVGSPHMPQTHGAWLTIIGVDICVATECN